MARLFISHSSRNNDKAIEVRDWLAANGWNDVFLDLDPERGIVAGQRWKEALQQAAYRCEVVLALVSAEWLASGWCKSEIDAARLMGKKIIVALTGIDKSQVPLDLIDEQYIDLSGDPQAYRRLTEGLKHAGLDPLSFPFEAGRRPYPGFAFFEEQDAAVFFGRDAQIVRGLDELRRLVRTGVSRMLVILGASGSGKSSFLRAGLWPRLKRDDRAWLPLPIVRPERAVISGTYGLAGALQQIMGEERFARGIRQRGLPRSRADIEDFIEKTGDGLVKLFEALRDIGQVPGLSGENISPPTIVLALDQGEELFNEEGRDEARRFVEILTRTLRADPRTLAILAMRSDSFPLVQADSSLAALPKDTFTLDMMLEGSYRAVIEEPAQLIQPTPLRIDPQLTDALLAEISGQDALPLLAFTLAHLYENYRADNELTLSGYDRLGRVGGVIDTAVKQAFAEGVAKGELPKDAKAQLALARAAFIPHLAQVNATGQFVRRVATRDQIPAEARPLIDSFAEQRLLIKDRRKDADGKDVDVVEVAHEALLRQPPFSEWLEEDRDFLIGRQQLQNDLRDWQEAKPADKKGALLTGLKLSRMRAWLEARPQDLTPQERDFGHASIEQADAEERRKARQRRIIMRASIAAAVVLACFAVAAGWQWRIANGAKVEAETQTQLATQAKEQADNNAKQADVAKVEAENQTRLANKAKEQADKNARQAQLERDKAQVRLLASEARRAASEATSPDGIQLAGALALASIAKSHKMALVPEADAIEAARSALIRLPLAVLGFGTPPRADAGSEEAISSLAVMADGRLVSRSTDGTIRLWPTGGNDKAVVLSPSSGEWSLADERLRASDKSKAVLEDGRLATAGQDGEIKISPKKGTGEPEIISSSNSAMSLAVLKDGRLAAGGFDGNITLLRTDQGTFRNGEPLVLFHTDDWYGGSSGKAVEALAVLPDGRLASGGQADLGGIKIWPTGAAGEPVVLWDHYVGAMTSLAVLADGRLASGVQDGTIRLWVKDVKGFADKPQNVLTHGNQIMSLAVLADGRLASSGDDDDGTIKLWRKEGTGEPIAVLRHGSPVGRIVALKDGRLASGDDDGTIKLWSTEDTGMVTGLAAVRPTREPVAVLRHGSRLSSLAVLEDGRLASGDDDGKIDIWAKDVEGFADKPEKVLTHGSQVLSLAVLADGRLASGGGDGTIKLWAKDAKDFADKPEKVLSQGSSSIHWEGIQSLAVLADRWLASGGADGLIKLWSTEVGGEPVVLSGPGSPGHALMGHGLGSGVSSLAVLPDGRLASAGYDGEIKLWLVDEQKLIGALCLRAGRNLTQGEWDRYIGPDIPWQESCRPFGVPSNWRTVDENKSGAPRPQ